MLDICVTIIVGLAIPYFLTKFLDNKKAQKQEVTDECKSTLEEVKQIKKIIDNCRISGSINIDEKNRVNSIFSDSDHKIFALASYLAVCFPEDYVDLYNPISSSYMDYWTSVTGNQFMAISFTSIDDVFYNDTRSKWMKFEQTLKSAILKISGL